MPNSIEGQSRTPVGAIFDSLATPTPHFFIGLIDSTRDGNKKVYVKLNSLIKVIFKEIKSV